MLLHNAICRSAHNLSATAQKVTSMAMALLPADLSTLSASFTFTDFCKAMGYTKGGESFKIFKDAIDECFESKISIEIPSDKKKGKKTWENYTWFDYSRLEEETGVAILSFSPKFASVLADFQRLYAKINLKDVGALQSKYALRIFEMAKSYESLAGQDGNKAGSFYFERSVQDFRKILGVPEDAYQETKRFKQFCLDNPVKEINAAGIGLNITIEGIKQGRTTAKYRLYCGITTRKIPAKGGRNKKNDAPGQMELQALSPKALLDKEEKELEHLMELYPDEFAALYAEELNKPSFLPAASGFRQLADRSAALLRLKEKYGIVK